MKKNIKILIGLMVGSSLVFGVSQATKRANKASRSQSGFIEGVDIPIAPHSNSATVLRNRLEMDTYKKADAYKEIQEKRIDREKVLREVFNIPILMTPVQRAIRSIDMIGLAPFYLSKILFPENMEITDVLASFKCNILDFNTNYIRIQPDFNTFIAGNIDIVLTDGKKNYTMTIFAERYFKKDCIVEKNSYICRKFNRDKSTNGEYVYAYNSLSTTYRYTRPKILEDMQTIIMYEELSKKLLNIEKNEESVFFKYDDVNYEIKRDDSFGKIHYRGNRYIIIIS